MSDPIELDDEDRAILNMDINAGRAEAAKELALLRAQRDELLAALEAVQRIPGHTGKTSEEGTACACGQCAQIRAAIARVKEGR